MIYLVNGMSYFSRSPAKREMKLAHRLRNGMGVGDFNPAKKLQGMCIVYAPVIIVPEDR